MGNNDDIFMARYSAFNPYRIRHSDMGYQKPIGSGDAMAKSLYYGMKPIATWMSDNSKCVPTGGVFNLEYSPEGSLLVAACEKRAIQVFDPLTHKRIHSVIGAHTDSVNCVKFLDERMFATCSDDTTIALWDVRNLSKKIRSLHGHSKWVKNIEYSVKDKLLVTSGLDGSIYTWDINSYRESNLVYQRVFYTSSLMRCRLSPDARQMVLCTTGGLIMIIHDLNLQTLETHLRGFKPNLYCLMQKTNQLIPVAAMYDHLFDINRKENRIELISDFPEGNDAEVVSALQIHPQGWSALSRNTSHDDKSEWTCIHDIQPGGGGDKSTRSPSPPRASPPRWCARRLRPRPYAGLRQQLDQPQVEVVAGGSRASSEEREPGAGPSRPRGALVAVEGCRHGRSASGNVPGLRAGCDSGGGGPGPRAGGGGPSPRAGRGAGGGGPGPRAGGGGPGPRAGGGGPGPSQGRSFIVANGAAGAASSRLGPLPQGLQNDLWEASITLEQQRLLQEIYIRGRVRPNVNMQRVTGIVTGISPPPPRAAAPCLHPAERPSTSDHSPRYTISEEARAATRHYVSQNRDRLLYYIEETNEGKGFIKELCFSADGRIVCSPFGRGMRLLALNDNFSELSHCVGGQNTPRHMVKVGQSLGHHQDLVVSSRFSPRYHLLVTGCLEGRIVWYQPHSGEM